MCTVRYAICSWTLVVQRVALDYSTSSRNVHIVLDLAGMTHLPELHLGLVFV